jgi:hypothetical protein
LPTWAPQCSLGAPRPTAPVFGNSVATLSERQFRRYRGRYEEDGVEGLVDRRVGKPSSKRVPAADARRMLELYGDVYRGWNVKHFHEHLVRDHHLCSWV